MKQQIPLGQIKFHPHSFGDHTVRLFRYNGELYRGISGERAVFFQKLFQESVIQKITEKGLLIESELTSFDVEGFDLVIRHRTIPFNSYPTEWCAAMLKDGMLTMIDLAIELAKQGLTLGDAHPWNLLFDLENNRPVFIDLGSIMPIDFSTWSVYDEFCRFCLYPLILMAYDHDEIARLLMFEDRGVVKSDVLQLVGEGIFLEETYQRSFLGFFEAKIQQLILKFPYSYRQKIKKQLLSIFSSVPITHQKLADSVSLMQNRKEKSHLEFLEKVRDEVEKIKINGYNQNYFETERKSSFSPENSWTAKQRNVYQILTELRPTSVLDISYHPGWYGQLAAVLGSQVISFDTDRNGTTQLYHDVLDKKIPMLPLIMDFTKSTPPRGLGNHWSIAATERLSCDMVLALGLVHHLVKERRLNFDQIAEGLFLFAKKWVLVEFIPRDDRELSQDGLERYPWYTLDNFIQVLQLKFKSVKIIPSAPEPRLLLLCKK